MKRALVTGANRGIGFAIATGLAVQGVEVMLGARDLAAGKAAARQIGASALELDVADPNSIEDAGKAVGQIDILVNNAEEFRRSMDVMVHGPYLLMHHLVPHMMQRNYGRVVNVSSGWGAFSDGVSGPGAYGAAKAALNALTVATARTLPPDVKVNAMCPGWVRTRMGGASASRSPEQGADTAIWLAMLPDNGPTGGFFRDRKKIPW